MIARIFAAGSIAFWALLLMVFAGQAPDYSSSYLLVFIIATLLILSGSRVFSGKLPWYSPHTAVLLALFLIYVMATTAVIHYRVPSDVYRRALSPGEVNGALWLALGGIISYLLGWRFGPKKTTASPRLEWFLTDTPAVQATFDYICFAMIGIGFAAWFYIFSFAGGISGQLANISGRNMTTAEAGGFVLHVAQFGYAGVLLYYSRRGFNPISIASLLLFLFILLVFGSRSYAGMLVLAFLAVYGFRFRGKIPFHVWIIAGASLFFLMTFWVLLRQTAGNIQYATQAYQQQMSSTESAVMQSLGDLMFIRQDAEMIGGMNKNFDQQWGRTFLVLLRVIPNVIWSSKEQFITSAPQLYLETFFPQRIGKVSLSVPLFLEFFINFNWLGVFIGATVMGVSVRWLDSKLIRNPHRRYQVPHIVICGLLLGLMVKLIKQGIPQIVEAMYLVVIPVSLVYFPNISLLLSPPPAGAGVELGDVPPGTELAPAGAT